MKRADFSRPGLETLIGLLSIESLSGAERRASAWLESRMRQLGFTAAEVDEVGNAIGVIGNGERQIVLLGHIDTVPGEIPLRLEGDRLYGRGSVDAKGSLAAFVDAAAQVGEKQGWQIVVIGAVGEEHESRGVRYILDRFHPDYLIVGEPSGWQRCTLGYKGSANAEVVVRRTHAHSAAQPASACDTAFDLVAGMRSWEANFNRDRSRVFDQLQLTLYGFSSGTDNLEDWACLQVGARLPEDLSPQSWYSRLVSLCAPETVKPTGYAIPAYRADKNTPLVRAMLAGIRSQGGRPGFVVKTGTADLNIAAPVWKCPAIAYGAGDSNLDHTPNEHILVSEFHQSVRVLSSALTTLMS